MRAAPLILFVSLLATTVGAQSGLRFNQLRDMIRSSIDQGLQDREIAKYLRSQNLSFQLTEALLEDFVGMGVGPRTYDALLKLKEQSVGMPEANTTPTAAAKPSQPPPPSQAEQDRIIAEARRNALEYTQRLPDFVCLQITRRYVDPSGLEMDWLKYDEIKTRVSYFEGRENYELVSVNNQITDKSYRDLGGATSTGEFGSMLRELFEPYTQTSFSWARHSLLRGHPVYVFHVRVSQPRSRFSISYMKQEEIITGYSGLVYIDKQTERVLRITTQAEDIPPTFPIREADTRLDYDYVDISGQEFLLPLKARMGMRESKLMSRNDVEFRLYRKFSAEASISFDEIDELEPLPEEQEAPNP